MFGFVQFEFGFLLGPGDGRFLIRSTPDEEPRRVLVIGTLGAAQRRLIGGRRGRKLTEAEPEPVPTTRVTVIRAEPCADASEAEAWLDAARKSAEDEALDALTVVNGALHAHRAARADPYTWDVGLDSALVVRIGYGSGEAVAEGRYAEAWEMPPGARRRAKRSMEAPEERFAALLGAREKVLPCEDLLLRARADLDAGRLRQAALQARLALESVLAEPEGTITAARREALEAGREPLAELGDRALRGEPADRAPHGEPADRPPRGEPPADSEQALEEAVGLMEAALRARRLDSAR